jgi:hypothetical protein
MSRALAVAVIAMIVGACSTTGAQMIGRDTFTSSARVFSGGESGAKGKVLKTAEESCALQGKFVKVIGVTAHECGLHGGCGEAQVNYMCLAKDDPRY